MARVRVRVIRAKVRNSDRGYESADNLNLARPPPSLYPLQYEKWTHIPTWLLAVFTYLKL